MPELSFFSVACGLWPSGEVGPFLMFISQNVSLDPLHPLSVTCVVVFPGCARSSWVWFSSCFGRSPSSSVSKPSKRDALLSSLSVGICSAIAVLSHATCFSSPLRATLRLLPTPSHGLANSVFLVSTGIDMLMQVRRYLLLGTPMSTKRTRQNIGKENSERFHKTKQAIMAQDTRDRDRKEIRNKRKPIEQETMN